MAIPPELTSCCCNCSCEDTGTPPFVAGQDHTAAPYRVRCQHEYGLDSGIYPFAHKKASQVVPFYTPSLSPTPLQRPGIGGGGGMCDCTNPLTYPSGTPAGANWTSYNIDLQPETWQGSNQDLLASGFQTFLASGTADYGVCHNYGHKEVMGREQWYGMYAFTSLDSCASPSRSNAADTNRYRTLTATFSFVQGQAVTASIVDPVGQPAQSGAISFVGTVAITIDKWSGAISVNQIVPLSLAGTTIGGFTGPNGQWVSTAGNRLLFAGPGLQPAMCNEDYRAFLAPIINGIAVNIFCNGYNNSGAIEDMEWVVQNICSVSGMTLGGGSTPSNASASFSSSTPVVWSNGTITNLASIATTAVISATDFKYTQAASYYKGVTSAGTAYDSIGSGGVTFSLEIALSDSWTPSDVRTDIETNLLSLWNLSNHAQTPWRHDQFPSIMPLVTRRQVPINVSPMQDIINAANGLYSSSQGIQCTCTDGTAFDVGVGNMIVGTVAVGPTGVKAGQSIVFFAVAPILALWVTKTITSIIDSTHFVVNGVTNADMIYGVQQFGIVGTSQYDGKIYGAPNSTGTGAVGWFDFYFTDTRFCATLNWPSPCGGNQFQEYGYAFGGNLSDAQLSVSDLVLCNDLRAYSTLLPQCATHWTGNAEAHNIPFGAMIDMSGITAVGIDSPISIVKHAKARLPVPSYSFDRPYGPDRCLIDEPTARYLATFGDVAGTTQILASAFVPSITSAMVIMIYGSNVNDGFWTGCSSSGTTLTLGTKIAEIPTGFTRLFIAQLRAGNVWYGIAGIVRFTPTNPLMVSTYSLTNPSAWPFGGRQAITFASDGISKSIVSFTTAQPYLWTGDIVDLCSGTSTAVTVLQANQTIHRFDLFKASHAYSVGDCVFDGTNGQLCTTAGTSGALAPTWLTTLGSHTPSGSGTLVFTLIKLAPNTDKDFWVNIAPASLAGCTWAINPLTPVSGPTAPQWYLDDTSQKFDCRFGSWRTVGRPTGGTVTFGGCNSDCLPLSPCFPQVIAFTPNGESWPNMTVPDGMGGTTMAATGHNYWFGSGGLQDFLPDGIFWARVQAVAEFEAADPLWQAPATPPNSFPLGIFHQPVIEDFGGCSDDDPIVPFGSAAKLYFPPHPMVEAKCAVPGGYPALPTDAVNGALTWPAMVQPVNPGVIGQNYHASMDYFALYTNELNAIEAGKMSGIPCRWLNYYYAHTLGGDK